MFPIERTLGIAERRLSFFHTHTLERLDVVYVRDGQYVEPALIEINEFLGDFRTGELITIDPALLDTIPLPVATNGFGQIRRYTIGSTT